MNRFKEINVVYTTPQYSSRKVIKKPESATDEFLAVH